MKRWYIKAITPLSGLNSLKFIAKDLLIDSNSSINTVIMSFLSIDCSTDLASLFVKIKSKTFSKFLQSDKSSNDLLMKQIVDFFEENNIKFEDISKIFVNQGPGNFSGLRVSLAVAKGISISKSINLFGYNTFIWSCAKLIEKKYPIYCIIKFREKFFIKKFNTNLNKSLKVKETNEKEIISKYNDKYKVIPENFVNKIDKKILELNNLKIVKLDHNDLESLQLKGLLDEDLIKPLYLS